MDSATDFIAKYTPACRGQIDFAWNGKHAQEFEDSNQEFRWRVIKECIARPEEAPVNLLEHLFLADAEWAVQAWGSPHHFAQLGSLLLVRGREEVIDSFARGFVRSFDTFGACHEIQLASELVSQLTGEATSLLSTATDESQRKRLEAVVELFTKMGNKTATEGWAKIGAGTPVSNIRIVWPRWYHKLWKRFSRLF